MCLQLVALAAGAAASAAIAMSASKKSRPSPLQAPPPPQEMKAADVEALRKANQGVKTGVNAGTASTLLTGPEGVKDPLNTSKNTLLGQ